MKKVHLGRTLGLTAAIVLGGGLSAVADVVNLQFTWGDPGTPGSLWESGFSGNYIQSDDAIGIYQFNQFGTLNNTIANPLYSVCLSPAGLLNGGQYTYNVIPFSQASPGIFPSAWAVGPTGQAWGINNAAYLWNKYGMAIVNNTGGAYTGEQKAAAAALEFAIWTALYDSKGYGALGGSTWTQPSLDSTTHGYYNKFLSGLTASGITGPQFTGNILEGQGALGDGGNGQTGQSQELFALGTPVPEPSTMVMGAMLLLPFGLSALRLLRRKPAA